MKKTKHKHINNVKTTKNNNAGTDVKKINQGRFNFTMDWCNSNFDQHGIWSWGESRDHTICEIDYVRTWLDSFKSSYWCEIESQVSNGYYRHHLQDIESIQKEARTRWVDVLNLIDYSDNLFRFRISSRKRLWGYVLGRKFFLVWYDRKHKIYPVEKKHT